MHLIRLVIASVLFSFRLQHKEMGDSSLPSWDLFDFASMQHVYICVGVLCGCATEGVWVYIYICVCVCVCVCYGEREIVLWILDYMLVHFMMNRSVERVDCYGRSAMFRVNFQD